MEFNEILNKRCSIREFSTKPVKWDKVLEAIDAACQSPFAGNINNLKFIIVENQDLKNKITECCQQDWIADAPIIVVVCSDETQLTIMYDERGKIYSKQQVGAAIQTFLLKIIDLGLSSCWVGSYTDENIKSCLKIPQKINIEAVLPIGYKSRTCKPKKLRKKPLEEVILWESWKNEKKPKTLKDPTTM